MHQVETFFVLLVAVAGLATLARRLRIPEPIPLVVGGLALGFIPVLSAVEFPPEVVFVLFVPPLVYIGGVLTPWRDMKRNLRPILALAVGLVLASIVAVAVVTRAVVSEPMPWAIAFVLGTIVAPPDAVAVMAVTKRLKVPRRIVNILEGESLANDTVALVAYKMAVAAAVTGGFSMAVAGRDLAWAGIGGLLIGLLTGATMLWVRRRISDPIVQTTLSLVTPFAAYFPAEAVGASGVLAVVTAGVYVGRYSSQYFAAEVRVLALSFWRIVEFLLNGLAFILVGFQVRKVYLELGDYPLTELVEYTVAIVLTVIVVRLLWVFTAAYVPRFLIPALRKRDPAPAWQEVAVIGWAGIRGVDSLATALAVPVAISGGGDFPHRNLVIFLSFGVILATLVLQGFSLPLLIRWLKLRDDGLDEAEEMKGRIAASQAALRRLEELAGQPWMPSDVRDRMRTIYRSRLQRYEARLCDCGPDYETKAAAVRRLRLELLKAERVAVVELRDREIINDDALHEIERDIDLEELRVKEDDLDNDDND